MHDLRQLFLNHTGVGDRTVSKLEPLVGVKELALCGTSVTTLRFDRLGFSDCLQSLYLAGTYIDESTTESLVACHNLQDLDVGFTSVGVFNPGWLDGLTSLRWLGLAGATVSKECLEHISCLHNLEELSLFKAKVSADGLFALTHLQRLLVLNLLDTSITQDVAIRLRADLPQCDVVDPVAGLGLP